MTEEDECAVIEDMPRRLRQIDERLSRLESRAAGLPSPGLLGIVSDRLDKIDAMMRRIDALDERLSTIEHRRQERWAAIQMVAWPVLIIVVIMALTKLWPSSGR